MLPGGCWKPSQIREAHTAKGRLGRKAASTVGQTRRACAPRTLDMHHFSRLNSFQGTLLKLDTLNDVKPRTKTCTHHRSCLHCCRGTRHAHRPPSRREPQCETRTTAARPRHAAPLTSSPWTSSPRYQVPGHQIATKCLSKWCRKVDPRKAPNATTQSRTSRQPCNLLPSGQARLHAAGRLHRSNTCGTLQTALKTAATQSRHAHWHEPHGRIVAQAPKRQGTTADLLPRAKTHHQHSP